MGIRRRLQVGLVVLASTLGVAGCGQTSANADPSLAETALLWQELRGRTFDGIALTGFEPLGAENVKLSFEDDGRVSFSAFCNTYFGTAELQGNVLMVPILGGTEIGCESDLMARDRWLSDLLSSQPTVSFADNELVITNAENSLTSTRREQLEFAWYDLSPAEANQVRAVSPEDTTRWQVLNHNGCLTFTNAEFGKVLPVFNGETPRRDYLIGGTVELSGTGPVTGTPPFQTDEGEFNPVGWHLPEACPTDIPVWVVW